jgi:hypothetical protein
VPARLKKIPRLFRGFFDFLAFRGIREGRVSLLAQAVRLGGDQAFRPTDGRIVLLPVFPRLESV